MAISITRQFQALAAAVRDAGGAGMVIDNADVAADGGNEGCQYANGDGNKKRKSYVPTETYKLAAWLFSWLDCSLFILANPDQSISVDFSRLPVSIDISNSFTVTVC